MKTLLRGAMFGALTLSAFATSVVAADAPTRNR